MASKKGKTICLFSSKGGVGKTIMTLNLAGICEKLQHKTLIIDLDLTNGGISVALNREVNKSIYNLIDDINNNRYKEFKDYVTKYDEYIAQGGTNISGGQKQRLAIARAIARDPEIYIFDDSFSALDYKTDYNLRKDLKKYTKDATVLIVAQRIGTIRNADQIIVLDNGKMVGHGTHRELMDNCPVYKEIALSQLTEEELYNE